MLSWTNYLLYISVSSSKNKDNNNIYFIGMKIKWDNKCKTLSRFLGYSKNSTSICVRIGRMCYVSKQPQCFSLFKQLGFVSSLWYIVNGVVRDFCSLSHSGTQADSRQHLDCCWTPKGIAPVINYSKISDMAHFHSILVGHSSAVASSNHMEIKKKYNSAMRPQRNEKQLSVEYLKWLPKY